MRNKVSIIITCYNRQDSIYKAIESCINQTYKNIEIIIINDCSTDNSKQIIENFNDDRITLINNEVNLGAGISRGIGILVAKGDYTTFLDSDDYYEYDNIEKLLNAAIDNNVDIVCPGYIVVYQQYKNNLIPRKELQTYNDRFNKANIDIKRFLNPMLIKKTLWNNVEYSKRRFVEDTPTLFKLLYYSNNVLILDYAGYNYVQNENSLIHTSTKLKRDIYEALAAKDIHKFLKEHNINYISGLLLKINNIWKKYSYDDLLNYKEECIELFDYMKNLFNIDINDKETLNR